MILHKGNITGDCETSCNSVDTWIVRCSVQLRIYGYYSNSVCYIGLSVKTIKSDLWCSFHLVSLFSFPGCRSFEEGDTPEDGLPVSENKAESFWLSEHLCCAPVEYMFLLLALESAGTN